MNRKAIRHPGHEHSVPWFWPMAATIEFEQKGLDLFVDNMRFIENAAKLEAPPDPEWATENRVIAELDTMRLRDFSQGDDALAHLPVLIDAPYAGHASTIADFAKGQSLVETLMAAGLPRVVLTDWKSATPQMREYDIDKYLADIDAAVTALGGRVRP